VSVSLARDLSRIVTTITTTNDAIIHTDGPQVPAQPGESSVVKRGALDVAATATSAERRARTFRQRN